MSNPFQNISTVPPEHSTHDLSHENLLSLNMGDLVPIFTREVLPGDSFNIRPEIFLRMMPTLAPIFHRCNVHVHAFFVPNRLCWSNWPEFITGGDKGDKFPVHPHINVRLAAEAYGMDKVRKGSLYDYLGLPAIPDSLNIGDLSDDFTINALPFRAYTKIYDEWYRNEVLQDPIDINIDEDGEDNSEGLFILRKRNWEKDRFTSALPTPQKGADVLIPLTGTLSQTNIPVNYITGHDQKLRHTDGSNVTTAGEMMAYNGGAATDTMAVKDGTTGTFDYNVNIDPNGSLGVNVNLDLNAINGSATINDLREASKVQQFLELNMRGGSRYTEYIKSHFNVDSSDKTLQRPEFIGGFSQPIVMSEIPQTSATQDDSVQGTLVGKGTSVGGGENIHYRSEEHGWIMILMSVMPKTSYSQGIEPQFTRRDRLDYFVPIFGHIGEQPVKNQEVIAEYNNNNSDPDSWNNKTFGYQPYGTEYRYIPSRICADMRDNLSFWHMGRLFDWGNPEDVALNTQFITCDATTRIFPVEELNNRPVYGQVYFDIKAHRPVPFTGDPGIHIL